MRDTYCVCRVSEKWDGARGTWQVTGCWNAQAQSIGMFRTQSDKRIEDGL